MAQAEAGKGSKPRKAQDLDAYSDGYDRIFGRKKVKDDIMFDAREIVIAAYTAFEDSSDSASIGEWIEFMPEPKSLIPLNASSAEHVTVEMVRSVWSEPNNTIFNGYLIVIVDSEGGYEVGGDAVSRVFGVYPILSNNDVGEMNVSFQVTVDYTKGKFCELNGYYTSYDGTTYDDITDIRNVSPKLVTVVKYE